MSDTLEYMDIEEAKDPSPCGRRGDGGLYLALASESEEGLLALRYAARMAEMNRGHLLILHMIHVDDFQHWSNVEEMMRKELREEAEKFLWNMAKRVNDINGQIPALCIAEGKSSDVLIDLINEETAIKMLILGGGVSAGGPGPLVSYFTGKGLSRLRVPVVVVPGHLDAQKIDAIF